jgi:polysaccharide deacetylase 2 family uncharacterized protein YibQ
MAIIRGILGFISGIIVSGAALAALTTYMPMILGTYEAKQADVSQDAVPAVEAEAPVVENIPPVAETVAETAVKDAVPEATSEEPVAEPPEIAVVEQEQAVETPKVEAEVAVVEPEPVIVEPEQPAAVEPEAEPEVVLKTDVPEVVPEVVDVPKKITLPTIETTQPAPEPEPEVVVEEPIVETGITVGKKPSSTLPTITNEAPTEITEEITQDAAPDNALEFNATAFEDNEQPLLGLILVDIGKDGLDVDKLKKLNAPLTIAIRVNDPNASERALKYNEAGFEVIAMAAVGEAAALNNAGNAAQVQNALDVIFNTVPNAIGLLDNAQGSIQKNNRISGDLVDSLQATGHGLITNAKGLNSIDRVADAQGVRSGKIARSLDANGEEKSQMVRYLDKASLDAGRDGSVIILGTTAKETVATVAVWLLSSKGQSVTLAPASAVLLR